MVRVSIDEVKQNLSVDLLRVEGGETVIIMKNVKPLAEFKPIASASILLRPHFHTSPANEKKRGNR